SPVSMPAQPTARTLQSGLFSVVWFEGLFPNVDRDDFAGQASYRAAVAVVQCAGWFGAACRQARRVSRDSACCVSGSVPPVFPAAGPAGAVAEPPAAERRPAGF